MAGPGVTGIPAATAVFDVLGGPDALLPSLTRVKPRLAVLGALGCVGLMAGAIVFHIQLGEASLSGVEAARVRP